MKKNILYTIVIFIFFIIIPFCLSMIFPYNFVLIISILLFSFGLILGASFLYRIDEYKE